MTDSGLASLEKLSSLEELTLYRTKVSNAGLARLAHLTQLRALDVRYSRVTASSIKRLGRLPGVAVLADDAGNRTARRSVEVGVGKGKGEEAIAKWLRSIGAQVHVRDGHTTAVSRSRRRRSRSRGRDPAGAAAARRAEPACHRNQRPRGRAPFVDPDVEEADLSHTLLSDSALEKIATLTGLQTLDLSHTLVEGTGLGALAGLTALREINSATPRCATKAWR